MGALTQTVQPGSTLWAIARDNLGDGMLYVSVFNANADQIRDPDLIYPGQVFVIPDR
nr:LysM peptidoglycan-binding domain-containing protein [Loktanella sp. M215]